MRFTRKTRLVTAIFILFQILGFFSSIDAILQTRTPQGAIAWTLSLNTIPIVAVPAYWVLGRTKFHGYVEEQREYAEDIRSSMERINKEMGPYQVDAPETFPEYEAIKKLSHAHLTTGNQVELLLNGENTFASIEAGIESAQSYVLFQFYILRPDGIGTRFQEQLIRKAGEGVAVYVLYDELGSSGLTKDWLAQLTDAGVQVLPFNTRQGPRNRFQLNFRNHRKTVVVDGHTAWVGGLNVGDDYLGMNPDLTPWRDTHMRIQGPAVLAAQGAFLADWHWASKEILTGLSWSPQAADGADQHVLILSSGPADQWETASLFFTTILNLARERIWIATPYFIPDEATMVALRLALLKGLDVRILTPANNDSWIIRQASNVYLSELAGLGAQIHFYEKGFMHQKVMLVDDHLAIVGTVNFDNRSFRLNFEVSGVVVDQGFAEEIEAMLEEDLSNASRQMDYSLDEESLWEQFKARGSALLAPVL